MYEHGFVAWGCLVTRSPVIYAACIPLGLSNQELHVAVSSLEVSIFQRRYSKYMPACLWFVILGRSGIRKPQKDQNINPSGYSRGIPALCFLDLKIIFRVQNTQARKRIPAACTVSERSHWQDLPRKNKVLTLLYVLETVVQNLHTWKLGIPPHDVSPYIVIRHRIWRSEQLRLYCPGTHNWNPVRD